MVRLATISAAASLLGTSFVAAADFQITTPSSANWWVAKSQNTLAWTCNTSPPAQQYSVLVGNKNVNVLTAPIAVLGILNNYDCSHTITQDQSNQSPAKGYFIQLANIVNISDVYYTSEEFEIKPLGSFYPSQGTPSSTGSGASGTQTGANPHPTNGGISLTSSVASLGLAFFGALVGMVVA